MAAAASPRMMVPGIQNLGNTCFFNAILQALASVGSFQEYLTEIVGLSKGRTHQIPFTQALRDCLKALAPTSEDEPKPPVVPRTLNAQLVHKLVSFRGNKQQDSQELLQFLMNIVSDEQRRCAVKDIGLNDLFRPMGMDTSSKSISELQFDQAVEQKHWNPLHGLQVNLLQCTRCRRYRPMKNQRFLDVSLSFGDPSVLAKMAKKPQSIKLVECLQMYTEPEVISGVECSYCSAIEGLATTRRELAELAEVERRLQLKQAAKKKDQERGDSATHNHIDEGDDESEQEVDVLIAQHERQVWVHTLEQLLASNTAFNLEDLERPVPRVLGDCHKRLQFSRSPDVFCFHFNRKVYNAWSGSTRKVDSFVEFPLELDMSAFCEYELGATAEQKLMNGFIRRDSRGQAKLASYLPAFPVTKLMQQHLIYELAAVILHHGNDRCGHFTAYRRIANGQWFYTSDDSVRHASTEEVLSCCAYMLFYERKFRIRRSCRTESEETDDDSLPDVPFEYELNH